MNVFTADYARILDALELYASEFFPEHLAREYAGPGGLISLMRMEMSLIEESAAETPIPEPLA